MVALAMLAAGVALASGIRVLRSSRGGSAAPGESHKRAGRQLEISIPPIPPVPAVPPDVPDREIRRELDRQLKIAVPRAGTLGLIAGARALQKAGRTARAEELLRRSRDPLARLELFLVQRQAGRGADAQAALREFVRTAEDEDWPAPLLRAYLGEAKDDAVLSAATDSDERCEAHYYLGRLHAPEDAALARRELQKAVSDDCDQADFAREELQAVQSR
jgi:hypothetical protein